MVEQGSGRCVGVTRDGSPCNAKPRPGADSCPWHDEGLAARRAEWSRKGGANRATAVRARKALPAGVLTNEELRGLVGITIKRVLAEKTEPAIGNSVAALARAYVAVAEAGAVEDLQRRLDELEALAGRRGTA